jgi:hypothetical protein
VQTFGGTRGPQLISSFPQTVEGGSLNDGSPLVRRHNSEALGEKLLRWLVEKIPEGAKCCLEIFNSPRPWLLTRFVFLQSGAKYQYQRGGNPPQIG